MTADAGVGAHLEYPSTPRQTCSEHSKPMVGMIFDTLTYEEKFYKSYAHDAGFSVLIGQQKKRMEEVLIKRYLCSREGYRKEEDNNVIGAFGKRKERHIT